MKKPIIKKSISLVLGITMLSTGFCLPNSNVFSNNSVTVSAASCHHNSTTVTYGEWTKAWKDDPEHFISHILMGTEVRTITYTCNRCHKVTLTRKEHRTIFRYL